MCHVLCILFFVWYAVLFILNSLRFAFLFILLRLFAFNNLKNSNQIVMKNGYYSVWWYEWVAKRCDVYQPTGSQHFSCLVIVYRPENLSNNIFSLKYWARSALICFHLFSHCTRYPTYGCLFYCGLPFLVLVLKPQIDARKLLVRMIAT